LGAPLLAHDLHAGVDALKTFAFVAFVAFVLERTGEATTSSEQHRDLREMAGCPQHLLLSASRLRAMLEQE